MAGLSVTVAIFISVAPIDCPGRSHQDEMKPPYQGSLCRKLALQATLQVQPADKRLSLVLRIGLVIGSSLIERFDSEKACNLLARKTHVLELPNVRHGGELLS